MKEQAKTLGRFLPVLFLVPFVVVLTASQPEPSADTPPGEVQTCLTCHDGYDAALAMTPHHLYKKSGDQSEIRIACTDCHKGDARHYNEDPEQYPMTNPASVNPAAEGKICSACHLNSHQQNMAEKNVHARNEVNCSSCHSVHASVEPPLLKQAQPGLCLGCHTGVKSQFARPFRHPVEDAVVNCTDCHTNLDAGTRDPSRTESTMCAECHGEFQGPFPYEHQATVDYSTQEGGCMNCHDPHGSYLPRMLKQPYEAPDFQLCKQCHTVPLHQFNSHHGNAWANIDCNECHVDIHGSYTSRNFLSESLRDRGCLKAGCHQ